MRINNERDAKKFIDDIFTRIDYYECVTAIDSLPKVDDLMKRFPALESTYRGVYKVYQAELDL